MRERLALIVRNASDFIGIADLEGIPLDANDAAIRMVGAADLDEMRRTPVAEYFMPEDRDFVRGVVLPTVLREGRWRGELRLRHFRTGAPIPIIYDIFLIRDPRSGEPLHFATISRDISDEKRRTAALTALNSRIERQAQLFDTIRDFACITDTAGRVDYANKALLEIWGRTLGEVRGRTFREIGYDAALAGRLEEQIAQAVREARAIAAETEYVSPTGIYGVYEYLINPVFDANDGVQALAISTRDVTQRKAVEDMLRENAERLRVALDAAAAGTFRWDIQSDRVRWDEPLDRLLGLPPGRTPRTLEQFLALVHPEDRATVTAQVASSRLHGTDFDMEFRVIRPDGTERWLHDRGKTFFENGRAMYMTGACVDVTDRKRAEAQARDTAERLALAMEATGAGAWDYYPLTGELIWDERCRRLMGVRPGEAVTYGLFLDTVHPADREGAQAAVTAALDPAGSGTYACEFRCSRTDGGEPRWVYATGRAVFANGKAARFIGTVQDISERKRAEEALRDADRRKSEFLAILAHELRNPLAPIRNGLELMRLAGDDPARVAMVRPVMERQVRHMVRLIDDLMDLSRINHGRIQLDRRPLDIARLVRTAVESSLPLMESRGHALTLNLPQQPVYVDADETRMTQVIANLLNNAAHYTPPGGAVYVDADQRGSTAVVSVRDTGIGIPPEMQARIFESFTRLPTASGSTGGLGIGLALSAQLVRIHGGSIEVRSGGPGLGAEFVVTLPAAGTQPAVAEVEPRRARAPRRILLADDNADAAQALGAMLEAMGHDVRAVHHGSEVVDAVRAFEPELLLLDIGMPDIDGYDVCRRVRAEIPAAARPLISALTGWAQEEDRRRAQEAGFDHHLVKPVDLAELDALFARLDGG